MTAENYKKHLLKQKELGRQEPRPLYDQERAVIWDEVFSVEEKKSSKKKE